MHTHPFIILLVVSLIITALVITVENLFSIRNIHRELNQRKQRKTRINAKAPEHGLVFAPGLAIEINADDTLPEWIKLAPFGEHPTRDKKAVQVFNAESAAQIISWFNFFPRKLARLANINSVKVWVGHPDFAPEQWPERIDLGSITELKHDETDMWGKVRWNAGAIDHVRQHKFPSVAWDCEVNGDGTETPAFLWSVGMWHRPNIKSVEAVINASTEEDPESEPALSGDPQLETEPEPETPMLKSIMAALIAAGIVKETDDENAVIGAIGSMIQALAWKREEAARQATMAAQMRTALNAVADVADVQDDGLAPVLVEQFNATTTELVTLRTQVTDLTAARAAERTERINAIIDRAIETGRIIKAEEETLREQLNANLESGVSSLLAKPVQLNCKPLSLGGSKPAVMEAAERMTRLNAWVSNKVDSGMSYDAAWEASKSDPVTKPIHVAMAQADTSASE